MNVANFYHQMMKINVDEIDGALEYCRHFASLCTEIENEGENLDTKWIKNVLNNVPGTLLQPGAEFEHNVGRKVCLKSEFITKLGENEANLMLVADRRHTFLLATLRRNFRACKLIP